MSTTSRSSTTATATRWATRCCARWPPDSPGCAADSAFRYGGEEFTLVFPGKSVAEAKDAAEAVRAAVADEPFTVRSPARPSKTKKGKAKRGQGGGEKNLKVTVSAGVAARSDLRPTPEDVLKAADKALYRAKKAGRNRVAVGK